MHEECAATLHLGSVSNDQEEPIQGRIDPLKLRRVWIATLTPALDAAPEKTTVKQVEKWFRHYADSSISMLFKSLIWLGTAVHGDRLIKT